MYKKVLRKHHAVFLFSVVSEVGARRMLTKNRSLHAVNEDFEETSNAAPTSATAG